MQPETWNPKSIEKEKKKTYENATRDLEPKKQQKKGIENAA